MSAYVNTHALHRVKEWITEMDAVIDEHGSGPNVWDVAASLDVDDVRVLIDNLMSLQDWWKTRER